MSTAQDYTSYTIVGDLQVNTAGGTQCNGAMQLSIVAGTDITDAEVFAIQQAIVAAFPSAWAVNNGNIEAAKLDTALTEYQTNYTANPPSFT